MSTNLEYGARERQRKRESGRQASEEKQQGENERQWKNKVNKNAYDISSIEHVTRKFLEISRCSRAKQRQRNVQKNCAARAVRPIVDFFAVLVASA